MSEKRIAVVTGANRGIGRAVAEELGRHGLHVVVVARRADAGAPVRAAIEAAGGSADLLLGDVGSISGARHLARDLLAACPRIDVLVHNAGLWPERHELNEDGLERAFAVNHVAPFVLNHLLEDRLVVSRTRVVQVSAGLYVKGRVDLERTPRGEDFHAIRTYATTKLCNLLVMPLFAERWRGRGPTIVAVHPGVIRTGLGDRGGLLGAALRLVKKTWKDPAAGARPVVRLALEHALAESGLYFHEETEAALAENASDRAVAGALWERTMLLAGLDAAPPLAHEERTSASP